MSNGASRLFNVMKQTSEETNTSPSEVVSLTVKSIQPLIFNRDDRLEITEDFCIFSKLIRQEDLQIGDVVTALVLNEGQNYFIEYNNNDIDIISEIEELKKQINDKNIITIGLNSDISITATRQYQTTDVELTKEMEKIGTKLSLSNGKVLVGKGVSTVLVSANMQTQGDNLTYGLMIYKNNIEYVKTYAKPENTTYHSISVSPVLLKVNEGDIIKMVIYINNNNSTKNIKAYDGNTTYLAVEAIN